MSIPECVKQGHSKRLPSTHLLLRSTPGHWRTGTNQLQRQCSPPLLLKLAQLPCLNRQHACPASPESESRPRQQQRANAPGCSHHCWTEAHACEEPRTHQQAALAGKRADLVGTRADLVGGKEKGTHTARRVPSTTAVRSTSSTRLHWPLPSRLWS